MFEFGGMHHLQPVDVDVHGSFFHIENVEYLNSTKFGFCSAGAIIVTYYLFISQVHRAVEGNFLVFQN